MDIKRVYIKYQVIYYSKFYCELNYIKYFQYNEKNQTQHYYKCTIKKLKKDVFKTLNLIKSSTILKYYKSCFKKIDLYKEKIVYRKKKQKKLISYKKT